MASATAATRNIASRGEELLTLDSGAVKVGLDRVNLGPRSTYRDRYWLIVGRAAQLAARLDALWRKHSGEHAELNHP